MAITVEKTARPIPCEHCRVRRRKCVALEGTSCERCRAKMLVCLFRFPPKKPVKRIRQRSRQKMSENKVAREMEQLQLQLVVFEDQLRRVAKRTSTVRFSVTQHQGRLSLNAPVRSLHDMACFLEQTWSSIFQNESIILHNPTPWSAAAADGESASLPITFKRLDIEQLLFKLVIRNPVRKKTRVLQQPCTQFNVSNGVKRHLLDACFSCTQHYTPIVAGDALKQLFYSDLDSYLVNAVAAYMAISPCSHIHADRLPCDRLVLGKFLHARASAQLRDVLFEEDEPGLIKVIAIISVSSTNLALMQPDEARRLMDVGWWMALELQSTYHPVLYAADPSCLGPILRAEAETWRRCMIVIRFIRRSLMSYESFVTDDRVPAVGLPVAQGGEQDDIIEVFRQLSALTCMPDPVLQINAANIDRISCTDVWKTEHWLYDFWQRLPDHYALTRRSPFEILDLHHLRTVPAGVLLVQKSFYFQWLIFEMRLMAVPVHQQQQQQQQSFSFDRLDSERALVIVSVCCDAYIKASIAFEEKRGSCTFDTHSFLVIAELLQKLTLSSDVAIRTRAQENLIHLSHLLKDAAGDNRSIPKSFYDQMKQYSQKMFTAGSGMHPLKYH